MTLTAKETIFVLSFCMHHDAARAAKEAYASKPGQDLIAGYRIMKRPNVCKAIKRIEYNERQQQKINDQWVLDKLVNIVEVSAMDFTELDEFGRWKYNLANLTPFQWEAIHSIKYHADGSLEIKCYDKLRGLEVLGKHVKIKAFREQIGVAGPDGGPLEIKELSDAALDAKIAKLVGDNS